MGKSPKPLRIVVHPSLQGWEELEALAAQGHVIDPFSTFFNVDLGSADLILGPTCHRMNEDYRKYLHLALAEGRRIKYPKGTKETDE